MDIVISVPIVPAGVAFLAFFTMMVIGCNSESCGYIPWVSLVACVVSYFFVSGLFAVFT